MKARGLDAVRVGSAALGSLVPWLAFVLAGTSASGAPLSLAFVGLPSMVAIVAGRAPRTRLLVTAVMTGVAVYAGVQVATIDDAQAGLAVLWVPFVAFPLATVVWVGGAVLARYEQEPPPGPARVSDRLAALVVDVVLVGAVLAVPVTVLSNAEAEVAAAVVAVVLATLYFAAFVAVAGRTPGQALLGLRVVDEVTGGPVAPARAVLRSLVLVAELLGASWLLLAPVALAELVAVVASGRSLTDRLFATSVVAGGPRRPSRRGRTTRSR